MKRVDRGNSFGWGTDFREQPPAHGQMLCWGGSWSGLFFLCGGLRVATPKTFRKFNAKYCGIVHSKTTMASETWVKITNRL
jgi:hypothetical protein